MDSGQLSHLVLTRYTVAKDGTTSVDVAEAARFEVQINPADFKHTCGLRYDKQQPHGANAVHPRFSAVDDESVSFSMVLDGTGVVPLSGGGQREDVKAQMKRLHSIVYDYVGAKKEPPHVRLLWGALIFFGRLQTLNTQYTLFKPSGDPLRARVDLSFIGAMSQQESTLVSNRAVAPVPTTVYVEDGDTLEKLCVAKYGNADRMLEVARENNLTRLYPLTPGTRLVLPPKE